MCHFYSQRAATSCKKIPRTEALLLWFWFELLIRATSAHSPLLTALLSPRFNFSPHISGVVHIIATSTFHFLTLDILQVNNIKETLMSRDKKVWKPQAHGWGRPLTAYKWCWSLVPSVIMFSLLFYLRYHDSSLLWTFHPLFDISANQGLSILFKNDWWQDFSD